MVVLVSCLLGTPVIFHTECECYNLKIYVLQFLACHFSDQGVWKTDSQTQLMNVTCAKSVMLLTV